MKTDFLNFSNFELIFFGSMAVLLFLLLLFIKRFFPFLIKNQTHKTLFKQYLPITEVIVWLIFILIAIRQFSDSSPIFALGLFLLLMLGASWVIWFWIKDFIAGALFKLNRDFFEKDTIQIDNFEGKILEMGNRLLKLETDSGEIIYFPYSKLNQQTIIKVHPGEMILNHAFTIRTAHREKAELLIEKIRFEVLSLPWSSIKRPPKIELIHEDDESYLFEVKIYSLEKLYFFKMEQEIRAKFEIK